MNRLYLLFVFALFANIATNAQHNIRTELEKANPALNKNMSVKEKLNLHKDYLSKAINAKNQTQQFFGLIYLFNDHLDNQDYPSAAKDAIQAENIAVATGNKSWQGFAKMKLGWLDLIVQKDMKAAIKKCEQGVQLCGEAKDSLCVGEGWEKMSTIYGNFKDFEKAHYYFNLAIPVLKRFESSHLGAAYHNYANLLAYQNRSAEALPYEDTAISIVRKQKDTRLETVYLTNRGLLLYETGKYDEALVLLKNSMAIDEKNQWLDNLVYDYNGMADTYYEMGNYKAAFDYKEKKHALRDSIAGEEVKLKIGELNAIYEPQSVEIELEKQERKLLSTQRSLERGKWSFALGLLIFLFGLWVWWSQRKKAKKEQLQSKNDLSELTRILIEKNSLLAALEQKVSTQAFGAIAAANLLGEKEILPAETTEEKIIIEEEQRIVKEEQEKSDDPNDFEKNIYNQRILTAADWSAFKIYFEKAYPGYLLRLRNAYPTLTEAEERLFLFTKLKLTNKEAAAILGISADSVKKTRTRLRKRLALDDKTELDQFVYEF